MATKPSLDVGVIMQTFGVACQHEMSKKLRSFF